MEFAVVAVGVGGLLVGGIILFFGLDDYDYGITALGAAVLACGIGIFATGLSHTVVDCNQKEVQPFTMTVNGKSYLVKTANICEDNTIEVKGKTTVHKSLPKVTVTP